MSSTAPLEDSSDMSSFGVVAPQLEPRQAGEAVMFAEVVLRRRRKQKDNLIERSYDFRRVVKERKRNEHRNTIIPLEKIFMASLLKQKDSRRIYKLSKVRARLGTTAVSASAAAAGPAPHGGPSAPDAVGTVTNTTASPSSVSAKSDVDNQQLYLPLPRTHVKLCHEHNKILLMSPSKRKRQAIRTEASVVDQNNSENNNTTGTDNNTNSNPNNSNKKQHHKDRNDKDGNGNSRSNTTTASVTIHESSSSSSSTASTATTDNTTTTADIPKNSISSLESLGQTSIAGGFKSEEPEELVKMQERVKLFLEVCSRRVILVVRNTANQPSSKSLQVLKVCSRLLLGGMGLVGEVWSSDGTCMVG
eukprot:GHVQ01027636.1.p1 GENE.GHVQ01027636.1~~GHVQ01027636.1.p1  ORF type:complete len:361 (+),score=88.91 GHVQ01027636.1:125-1207(+)